MRVAYLVNQYPKVSHSFIRRELLALEKQGVTVERFSIRSVADELVDPDDIAELGKTRVVLHAGAAQFIIAFIAAAVRSPRKFLDALKVTLRLAWPSRQRFKYLAYFIEACTLKRWLTQANVEHVHAHFSTNSTMVAMLSYLLGGPPYSFTVHGSEEFDMPIALALKTKVSHARFVAAISSFCRSQLYRWTDPALWDRVHVVRCGLDTSYFASTPHPIPEQPRLVCVARLSAEKGHFLLLEAARKVVDRGVDLQLTLAGDGPLRPQVEARIAALKLQKHVTITGWVSGTAVREAVLQARAVVLSSFAEGLPVVLMEALALHRPVVTVYVAGIPELVEPGRSGWLVPPGDRQALADAMFAAATEAPARLAEMAAHGHQRALQRHHVPAQAAKLKALFAGQASEDLAEIVASSPSTSSAR